MFKKIFTCLMATMFVFSCIIPFAKTAHAEESVGYYCDTTYGETNTNSATIHTLTIDCDYYEYEDTYITKTIPNYTNDAQSNSCAPMAGAIVLGYYDDVYTELIPNFTPGFVYNGVFRFRGATDEVFDVKYELYDLMGTNSINPGTSVAQFKSGLQTYVQNQGYSISYANCGTNINLSTAISHFQNQRPVVLFLNSYDYYPFSGMGTSSTTLSMVGKLSPNGHVAVAFGYREYSLYSGGEIFRTEKFLIVSMGDGTQGLIMVNSTSCVDEAYAITIS